MMKKKLILTLSTVPFFTFAQEQVVQVGKHANPNVDAFSMIMSLLMVLLLIFVAAWVLKKFNLVNKPVSGMKVVASLSLGTKERLMVVQVADKQLLLGVSTGQITLLKTLDEPLSVANPLSDDLSQSFSHLFQKNKHKQTELNKPE